MKNQAQSPAASDLARASRRRFTKTIAAAIVCEPFVAAAAAAQERPPAMKQAPAPPNPPTTAAQPPSPVAQAYTEVCRLRFGDKLTPAELDRMKRDIEGNIRTAERLSGF